jgi:Prophage antirepressor
MQRNNHLTVFAFESSAVRTIMIDGEPWFVATDIARILGYRDAANMIRMLDEDEAGTHLMSIRSENGVEQNREVTIINESGLYSCILRSNRQEAKRFRKWVTSEVLPQIRKTGAFGTQAIEPPAQPFILSGNPEHAADQMVSADRTFRAALRAGRQMGLDFPSSLRRANEIARQRTGLDLIQMMGVDPSDAGQASSRSASTPVRFGNDWLGEALPLPVCTCRSVDLYSAYVHWCDLRGLPADASNAFYPRLLRAFQQLTKHSSKAGGHMVRLVSVPETRQDTSKSRDQLNAEAIDRFADALGNWRRLQPHKR